MTGHKTVCSLTRKIWTMLPFRVKKTAKISQRFTCIASFSWQVAGFLFVFRLTDLDLQWLQVKYLLTIFITDCYFLLVIELLESECKVRNQSSLVTLEVWSPVVGVYCRTTFNGHAILQIQQNGQFFFIVRSNDFWSGTLWNSSRTQISKSLIWVSKMQ